MPKPHIITGQRVAPAKLELAKDQRRHMTPAEGRLWAALRGNRLDGLHFRRQQVIAGFVVDFYCHAADLVVEIDGPVHDGQAEYDRERSRGLEARGLRVLRVRNEEVMENLEGVLLQIRRACSCAFDLTPQPPSQPGKGEQCPADRCSPLLPGEGPGVR